MGDEVTLAQLAKAVIVTAEVMGYEISPIAAKDMARELSAYPAEAIAGALRRCKRELSGRLTLAAILQRLDDGRPGVESAWAMCAGARDEGATLVWTREMSAAWGVAEKLDDDVAARMAFKETYAALVTQARDQGVAVNWSVSLGHDKSRRSGPILEAVEAGRLPADGVDEYVHPGLPDFDSAHARLLRAQGKPPELPAPASPPTDDALWLLTSKIGARIP